MSERGLAELPQRIRAVWLEAAQQAPSENAQTFAVLPMRLVLGDEGYVAWFERMGYVVEAPR
jgi:hypothetical protein